jgi:hypothetical protein
MIPVFTPHHWAWALFIACGVGLSMLAFRRMPATRFHKRLLPLAALFFASSILIPFPYKLGPALLVPGILLALHRKTCRMAMGLVFSGIILSLQSAVVPLYFMWASRYHSATVAAPIVNSLLRMLGVDTTLSGDTVFIHTSTQVIAVATAWEKLGLLPVAAILVGGVVLLLLTSARRRDIALFIFLVLSYMLVRYVFLVLMYADNNRLDLFWMPIVTCLSFVPLFLLLMKVIPLQEVRHLGEFVPSRRALLLGGVAFLCVFSLLGVWGFHDPGTRKQGRILIDEKHSDWEWTTQEYDTGWYGEKSGYNYYSLYSYLQLYYQVDRNLNAEFDSDLLSSYDILIIKTPTKPFTPEEVDIMEAFVSNGGGLLLISDHTNVFGMSTYINPIAERFGLRFRYDATYDLNSGSLSEYRHPDMMPHPIVQHMPALLFATSCTVEAPLQADDVIIGYGLKSLEADYSQKSFFPAEGETAEMDFGLFLQAAAVTHGKGRVVAFTDSTIFSNFFMFMPGKPELALGIMEWLNRENSLTWIRFVILSWGIALLLIAIYLAVRLNRSTALLVIVCAAIVATPLASRTYGTLNMSEYPLPKPHTEATRVCFEQEHSDFELSSLLEGYLAEPQRRYDTFYVWNQRLGYVPSVNSSLEEALAQGSVVVIINPSVPLTGKEEDAISEYVHDGGKVLVMDSAGNTDSTSNELLRAFDMSIDLTPIAQSVVLYESDKQVMTTDSACSIQGGQALISTDDGRAILSISQYGQGKVAVFSDSYLFSNAQLGDVSSIPTELQMQRSELEFWILQDLVQSPIQGAKEHEE